jgi:hypothetical protein
VFSSFVWGNFRYKLVDAGIVVNGEMINDSYNVECNKAKPGLYSLGRNQYYRLNPASPNYWNKIHEIHAFPIYWAVCHGIWNHPNFREPKLNTLEFWTRDNTSNYDNPYWQEAINLGYRTDYPAYAEDMEFEVYQRTMAQTIINNR